jgi:hypothetical protein
LELPPSLEPTDTGGGTLAVRSVSTGSGGEIAATAAAGLNGDGRAGEWRLMAIRAWVVCSAPKKTVNLFEAL